MDIFGQIVRTAVNLVLVPVAVAKDVVLLGGVMAGDEPETPKALERLKREASPEK